MADAPEGYTVDPPAAAVNPDTGRLRITVAPIKVNAPVVTGGQVTPLPGGYAIDPSPPREGIPPAFLDRVASGSALQKTMSQNGIVGGLKAFGGGFQEGFGEEPIGWSPEHVQRFRELGIYRDPATGRGGPVRLFNESIMQPAGALGDLLTRSASGVAHGLANTFGALIEDAQGYLGNPDEARAEALNFLNERLLRGDAEFTRPEDHSTGPKDQVIGPLPQDGDFARAASLIGGDLGVTEANLRTHWQENGIHPAEAAADVANDNFLKSQLTAENWDGEGQTPRQAVGAEVTTDFPDMAQQPVHPPGALQATINKAIGWLSDIGHDIQMMIAPMTAGSRESMAAAKDFANTLRRNRWEWSRIDNWLSENLTPEQRERIWTASDEESVMRQEGPERNEAMGLGRLDPGERRVAEMINARAQDVWARMRDLGMVQGEGLPFYTPRMMFNLATAVEKDGAVALGGVGRNLRTKTSNLLERKYLLAADTEAAAKARLGEAAELARDIRVTPLALARLEDAIAGRKFVNEIRDIGKRTGDETISEGGKPADSEHKWFTIDHPALKTWRPDFETVDGKTVPRLDANGNIIFKQTPLYIRGDFEGPMRAVLSQKNGPLYNAAMSLKGKTMSLIMNSPLIHNAVEFGRAFPAMPGKVLTLRVYFQGNRAKNDLAIMREAIDSGLVPIGARFFNQDISSVMEEPNLKPGRSLTSKVLGLVPGLWDRVAGTNTEAAVKTAVDKAGDFWHNTLLWDRVGDLQMGLYVNFRDDLVAKGVDPQTSARVAAHLANRYAGSLPVEAMSNNARKVANMLMFSRTFTLGNIGVMKDAFTGLPRDVMAQIERDTGEMDPEAAGYAKALARRKAAMTILIDIGLMYATNSILQSAFNVLRGDSDLSQEEQGYVTRFYANLQRLEEHPFEAITPLSIAGGGIGAAVGGPVGAAVGTALGTGISQLKYLSSTYENEPGKQDRVLTGYAKDGTGIYARNVLGKIGEEFTGYTTNPLDMLLKKMAPVPRAMWHIINNDAGFGRPLYEPHPQTSKAMMGAIIKSAEHLMEQQAPTGQISAAWDLLVTGEGDKKVNTLQSLGPIGGVTFSKGFPGGPVVGLEHDIRQRFEYEFDAALPDIRKQILRGDVDGANARMSEMGVSRGMQRWVNRSTFNPATRYSGRTTREIYQHATPEERARMEGHQ